VGKRRRKKKGRELPIPLGRLAKDRHPGREKSKSDLFPYSSGKKEAYNVH